MKSELLRLFGRVDATPVSPDYESLEKSQGLPRFAADLGEYPKMQPLALVVLTHPADASDAGYITIDDADETPETGTYDFGYAPQDEPGLHRRAYAVPLDGLADFKKLHQELRHAFNKDAAAGLSDSLQIYGVYFPPEIAPSAPPKLTPSHLTSVRDFTAMAFHLETEEAALPSRLNSSNGRHL